MKVLNKVGLFLLIILASCGGSEISIKSTPAEAKVSIRTLGSDEVRELGMTPLSLDEGTVKELKSATQLQVLYIEKTGYLPETLIMPDLGNSKAEFDFKLRSNNFSNVIDKIDGVGTDLFKAQKLINRGSYSESINILKSLNESYPTSSLISELLAGAHYLSKDFSNSLLFYEQAYKNNPKNVEAYKMIKFLENEMGVQRPKLSKELQK